MKFKKPVLFALLTVLISLLASVLVMEIVIRIIYFQPRGRLAVPYENRLSELEGVNYELTPDHRYRWEYGPRKLFGRGLTIPVRINSHGYRGRELQDPKPDNHYRILALGDSFTLGLGVREEDTWVIQLEHLIRTEKSSVLATKYDSIEIVNTGVGSWNATIEYNFLRQKGMTHDPDAIIMGFCSNDFEHEDREYLVDEEGMLRPRSRGDTRTRFQGVLYEGGASKPWWKRIVENSHLIRWASNRNMVFQQQPLVAWYGKKEMEKVYRAVDGIHALTQQAGIPFYMCLFPYVEDTISVCDEQAFEELAAYCHSIDVSVLRMDEALKDHQAEDLWVHPRDHHPNATAHALYATHIYNYFFAKK